MLVAIFIHLGCLGKNVFFGTMSLLRALILNLFWRSQSDLLKYLEYKVFGIYLVYKKIKEPKIQNFWWLFLLKERNKNMFVLKRTPVWKLKKMLLFWNFDKYPQSYLWFYILPSGPFVIFWGNDFCPTLYYKAVACWACSPSTALYQ